MYVGNGETFCIGRGSEKYTVDICTGAVTACTELYGRNASLIELPEDWDELWDAVVAALDK